MLTPRKFLWAFITEQSEGEWDEDTIRADIERFMEMLEKERLALVPASRIARLENGLKSIIDVYDQGCSKKAMVRVARAVLRENDDAQSE